MLGSHRAAACILPFHQALGSFRCGCNLAVVLCLLVSLLGTVVFVVFSKVYVFGRRFPLSYSHCHLGSGPKTVFYYCNLVVIILYIQDYDPSSFFLLSQVHIYCLEVFNGQCNFEINCSSSLIDAISILRGIALNLLIGQDGHFENINSSIHEHLVEFHLFVSSSIYFIIVLSFSEYSSFTSLDRFILRYFILFDVIVNGTVFLIYFSTSSLLLYRNSTCFCILILYPATLLNPVFTYNCLMVEILWFSICSVISSSMSDHSTLPVWLFLSLNLASFPWIETPVLC